MGVIYKLRDEVIDAILEQKKNNPSLSCRQLASIISSWFQLEVSKSSINNILKSANLSSSVGRRADQEVKPKKFQIPVQKKKQIADILSKAGLDIAAPPAVSAADKKAAPPVGPPITKPEIQPAQEKKISTPKILEEKVSEGLPLMADPLERESTIGVALQKQSMEEEQKIISKEGFLEKVKESRAARANAALQVYDEMGCVFLKAVELEAVPNPILAQLVRKYFKEPLPYNLDAILEALMFLMASGMSHPQDAERYKHNGLWPMHGLVFSEGFKIFFEWTQTLEIPPSFLAEYTAIKNQIFLNVCGFKLFLEDGKQLFIDSHLTTLWSARIPPLFYNPFHKAMEGLSKNVISNYTPALFLGSAGSNGLTREFFEMVCVFDNTAGKRIIKAAMFDGQYHDIVEFTAIPFKKRFFISAIWPWQNEFKEVTKPVKWVAKKHFYQEAVDKVVTFTETHADLADAQPDAKTYRFRVLTIWEEDAAKPVFALLTNNQQMKAEEIISEFLLRWPNGENSPALAFLKKHALWNSPFESNPSGFYEEGMDSKNFNQAPMTLWDIAGDFVRALKKYAQAKSIFMGGQPSSLGLLDPIFYQIPGSMFQDKGNMRIHLKIPPQFPRPEALKQAVLRINECGLWGVKKPKIWVELGAYLG